MALSHCFTPYLSLKIHMHRTFHLDDSFSIEIVNQLMMKKNATVRIYKKSTLLPYPTITFMHLFLPYPMLLLYTPPYSAPRHKCPKFWMPVIFVPYVLGWCNIFHCAALGKWYNFCWFEKKSKEILTTRTNVVVHPCGDVTFAHVTYYICVFAPGT